jgi:hypothetical protein
MIAQTIGYCAAGICLLCLVGLFTIRVLWPAQDGTHAKKAKHRDDGQVHGGAGSPGHDEELRALRIIHTAAERRREPDTGEMADLVGADDEPSS